MRHPKKDWDTALDRIANKQAEDWDTALDRLAAKANKQAEDHERENKNDWPNVSDQMADETSPERENEASINSVANNTEAALDKLKEIKDLLDEKSQTLKRNADKSDGRPKTKRDKLRDQRLNVCVRLRKEGHTWEKICRDYRAAIRKHKTYIDDPKASQDTLRQMCQQYHPELKE